METVSCPQCPHCQSGVEKGGLALSGSGSLRTEKDKETPKSRGPARQYSAGFELSWKQYGRKEQKLEAFGVWLIRAKEAGGELKLTTLVLGALKWQAPLWSADAWKFAPYFERYLKRRKWEDERTTTMPRGVPPAARVGDASTAAVDRKVAEYRAAAARAPSPQELAAIAALRAAK